MCPHARPAIHMYPLQPRTSMLPNSNSFRGTGNLEQYRINMDPQQSSTVERSCTVNSPGKLSMLLRKKAVVGIMIEPIAL
jgi:hypothetical protein